MPLALNRGNNVLRSDPTRTTILRNQFEGELRKRIRAWMDDVYYFLVIQDALGLKGKGRNPFITLAKPMTGADPTALVANSFGFYLNNPPPQVATKAFEFRTDPQKVIEFQLWLEQQRKARLITAIDPLRPNQPWTAKYIQSAYKKGITKAFSQAKKSEALKGADVMAQKAAEFVKEAFAAPEAITKIQLLATRSFEDLKGITADMAGKMNRILAQGLIDGDGPDKIAKAMFEEVDGITKRRAVLVTRTEIINAHAEGQLDTFDELNVEDVGLEAEWLTAGDDRVCPQCEDQEGKIFTIEEARGMIPLHPNCRCSWTPAL
jgi:SPP1 gp7 family putative phage head morphogenesis protein